MVVKSIACCALLAALSGVAHADIIVTPKVGYDFKTDEGRVERKTAIDKHAVMYGVGLQKTLPGKFAVELEATQVSSDYDTRSYSVNGYKYFGDRNQGYVLVGAGYAENELSQAFENRKIDTPVINLGVGYRHRLTNMLGARAEMRTVHQTKERQHDAQFMVGFDINLNEISKPYSR